MGQLISLDAVAEEIGISKRSVRRLVSTGELRAFKIGERTVRVDTDDIAAVLRPIIPNGKP